MLILGTLAEMSFKDAPKAVRVPTLRAVNTLTALRNLLASEE